MTCNGCCANIWYITAADTVTYQASAIMSLRSVLLWDFTQRRLTAGYRRCGNTYWSHLQRSSSFSLDCFTLKGGTDWLYQKSLTTNLRCVTSQKSECLNSRYRNLYRNLDREAQNCFLGRWVVKSTTKQLVPHMFYGLLHDGCKISISILTYPMHCLFEDGALVRLDWERVHVSKAGSNQLGQLFNVDVFLFTTPLFITALIAVKT